jgi:hypothetical protein
MDIDSVPDRILAYSVAEEYELGFIFVPSVSLVGEKGWKGMGFCRVEVGSRDRGFTAPIDTISAEQFNSMTLEDLRGMCEYWRMAGLFRHG